MQVPQCIVLKYLIEIKRNFYKEKIFLTKKSKSVNCTDSFPAKIEFLIAIVGMIELDIV